MNAFNRKTTVFVICICAVMWLACTDQMQPAKQAIDGVETKINAASADASRYAPTQLASVQQRLAELRTYYQRKEYAIVVARAPDVLSEADTMAAVAAGKKSVALKAATAEWNDLNAAMPAELATIRARLDALSKSKRPAKGIDLPLAKSSLEDASAAWDRAQASNASGDVAAAVDGTHDAEAKAKSAAGALHLPLPANAGRSAGAQ
jgi:hypothetical protein